MDIMELPFFISHQIYIRNGTNVEINPGDAHITPASVLVAAAAHCAR
jgi:hypothetical protein